jgi:hypothetical protein
MKSSGVCASNLPVSYDWCDVLRTREQKFNLIVRPTTRPPHPLHTPSAPLLTHDDLRLCALIPMPSSSCMVGSMLLSSLLPLVCAQYSSCADCCNNGGHYNSCSGCQCNYGSSNSAALAGWSQHTPTAGRRYVRACHWKCSPMPCALAVAVTVAVAVSNV